jgi:hypothetical protein
VGSRGRRRSSGAFIQCELKGGSPAQGVGRPLTRCRNFTKFLVDGQGRVVGRYGPSTKPEALKEEIEKLLPA